LEYRLAPAARAVHLQGYALTSGSDAPERDPAYVVLEAWDEESAGWMTVDERRGLRFESRGQQVKYAVAAAVKPARRFRLRIVEVADPGAANSVQLAGWELLCVLTGKGMKAL
jgi:hypothetical protein